MFALAGVGNTVYHPADYALLSHHVPSDRIGQAFSVHTFAGMLGSAVAPASLLIDAKPMGLARRLYRRRRARFCGGGTAVGDARRRGQRTCRNRAPRAERTQDRGRLAAFAVAGDPAQSRLLRAARDDQRRHVQLFRGRIRRALRNAGDHRQSRRCPATCCCRRSACWSAACWSAALRATAWWRRSALAGIAVFTLLVAHSISARWR